MLSIKYTIITATCNSRNEFVGLAHNIRGFKFKYDIQWIVIDAASSDGTIDVINENLDIIDNWVSENDDGVYDAWNKGLNISVGDFVIFLGSDDRLADDYFETLNYFVVDTSKNIFGVRIQGRENKSFTLHNSSYKKPFFFPFRLGFHVQGTCFRRHLFLNKGFDKSYKIMGDSDFLMKNFSELAPTIIKTDLPLVFFSLGGISSSQKTLLLRHREMLRIYMSLRNVNSLVKSLFVMCSKLKILFLSVR